MKRIFKYELQVTDRQEINMPRLADILTVRIQNGKPFIWAIVDAGNPDEKREFEIIPTGAPINENLFDEEDKERNYIGTFEQSGGNLIWHLFELERF